MQRWDAAGYIAHAAYVTDHGRSVLDLLAPQPGEHVLDLGCGDGRLTAEIAASGATVLGVDASASMIKAARAQGLNARQGDAQALPFDTEFDAVFSNAALHWMPDHPAVLQGVSKALKPNGRFVGEFGGHGNVAAIVTALLAVLNRYGFDARSRLPFNFPTDRLFANQLQAAGFQVVEIALFPRPTPLPTGMEGWLATFAPAFMHGLSDEEIAQITLEVCELLDPSLCDDQGNWHADYVRLRFHAVKT